VCKFCSPVKRGRKIKHKYENQKHHLLLAHFPSFFSFENPSTNTDIMPLIQGAQKLIGRTLNGAQPALE
jgi:hypothetical protein